ncbi:two-component regulator propeller domain-containing protein [Eisenibacter elegans]|uniref:two-component regulator propeller domain-containing protein n=1 Tax=Eisenibacter elegans TaxID=997 RepID=UPI0004273639|nr:two-component regulator propeller domain-containing protein [Eisenibacter elegans]
MTKPTLRHSLYCLVLSALWVLSLLVWENSQAQSAELTIGLRPHKTVSQYLIDHWKRDRGLPQNSVFSILQDQQGFLWVSTYDGIARFDGTKFEGYNTENVPEMKANTVWKIFEDREKRLWFGTQDGGVTYLQNGVFRTLNTKDGLIDNMVYDIAQTPDGSLWMATRNGLSRFKDGKFRNYTKADGLIANQINRLLLDKDGSLWIGTTHGLQRWKAEQFEDFSRQLLLISRHINVLIQDLEGALWIGTNDGLVCWNPTKFIQTTFNSQPQVLKGRQVTCLWQDRHGSVWVGTQSEGLYRYLPQTQIWEQLTTNKGLAANHILTLCEDQEGSLWVGLSRGGLNRLRDGKFTNLSKTEGLSDNFANCIFQDRQKRVWVGTTNGGVNIIENQQVVRKIDTTQGLSGQYVRSVFQDNNGDIWVATYGQGLNRLRLEQTQEHLQIKVYTKADGLADNVCRAVIGRKAGGIWIATRNGLSAWDGQEFKNYTTAEGLKSNNLITLLEDRFQRLWIATDGAGLMVRYPNGQVDQFRMKDGLADDLVFSLYEDKQGAIWIGTKNGLSRWHEGKLQTITYRNGLAHNAVHSIAEDSQGRLWFSCSDGVYYVAKKDILDFWAGKRRKISCTLYDEYDGLASSDCAASATPSVCQDVNGQLWYPTTEGISFIQPTAPVRNTVVPPVAIQRLIANNVAYEVYPNTTMLRFKPGTTKFEFDFTALSFLAPERVQFRIKLQGFDKNWVDVGQKREAYYTNLPPGEYTFWVQAANNDGLWNEDGAWVKFYVAPFFYQTLWFYLLVGIGIVSSGGGVYYWRVQNLQKNQQRLEQEIQERTKQITAQYEQITRQTEELERMDAIVQAINSKLTLEGVLQALLAQGVQLYHPTRRGMLWICDPQLERFVLVAHKGDIPEDIQHYSPKPEVIYGHLQQAKQLDENIYLLAPKQAANVFADNQVYPTCAITICTDGVIEGLLILESNAFAQLNPKELSKLQRFNQHAMSAFSKARILQEIEDKNKAIESSFRKMEDSMQYAKRIQEAIFVRPEEIKKHFPDAFIFYSPKDIVSGDFYWFAETLPEPIYSIIETEEGRESVFSGFSETKKIIAAVDCTGHGVPGALMTVVGNDLLDNIVKEKQVQKPSAILRQLDMGIKTYLHQEEGTAANDGMDMALLVIDEVEQKVEFAGAKNPVIHIRNGELKEIKGVKYPIGGIQIKNKVFERHIIPYQPGDVFYIYSDGFQDQFGGEHDRKFGVRKFRELLLSISHLSMDEQNEVLQKTFDEWRGPQRQTDDVLVIGIRL